MLGEERGDYRLHIRKWQQHEHWRIRRLERPSRNAKCELLIPLQKEWYPGATWMRLRQLRLRHTNQTTAIL